jgi:hypothetical protein
MAFALISGARHSLHPPDGGTSNDATGFASRYGPLSRSRGLLTATQTGLTPASDDELTTKDQPHKVTFDLLVARMTRAK